jgi:hypothetical protein
MSREEEIRNLHNWMAWVINSLHEQSRRPDYVALEVLLLTVQKQIPKARQMVVYLKNTQELK